VSVSVPIRITEASYNNQLPLLRSTYTLYVKELKRKKLTSLELSISDKDNPEEQLKIIITHPPQYGSLEKLITNESHVEDSLNNESILKNLEDKQISINTNLNQTLNFIFKFNKNAISLNNKPHTKQNQRPTNRTYFTRVTEFSMADISAGLIWYNHQTPGARLDRFGFIVTDGINNYFVKEEMNALNSNIVSTISDVQIFTILVETDINEPPFIRSNLGLGYLFEINKRPGRLIQRSELEIIDKDDSESQLTIELIERPLYGQIEHVDRPAQSLNTFTQRDINYNKIYYALFKDLNETSYALGADYFMFDIVDSAKNRLHNNRFDIKWSLIEFEVNEISVLESEGRVRVYIKKTGNLKQYSTITCKTESDTAKSNRDHMTTHGKKYDFVHTITHIEFNEDESYKSCDVILQRDADLEPVEWFYLVLEDSKYSLIGSKRRIKINILDKIIGKYYNSLCIKN
jgi:hypothetical protein